MKLSLAKPSSETVGLDIDGSFLAAVVMDRGVIRRVASLDLAPGVTTEGEVRDPEALAEGLKELFRAFKLPRTVRLGVSNQQIVVRHLDMPMIENAAERDAAVRFQAAEAIAMPLGEAVFDYQPIGASEGADGILRQRLLVVAARESMIDRLLEGVRAAGLKPDGIDLNAFALVRMLGDDGDAPLDPTSPARVICHLGGVTNLAIAAGPICLFTRSLQTAWAPDDDSLIASLAEEIRLSLNFHMAQPDARPVDSIVLSGPGAEDGRVAEELAQRTGLSVSVGEPLGRFGTTTVLNGDDPARYTVAAGLALGVEA